jgi:hypothetical protein
MDGINHGTSYAEAQQCYRRNKKACPPCRAVLAAYQREHRRNDRTAYARELKANAARTRALWRLAQMHPGLFRALVAEEQQRESA